MATRAKNRKLIKRHLLQGQLADFKIISQKRSLKKHCSNCSTLLNKVAARAKNRKTHKMTSPPRPIGWFQHNLVEMFFGWPSTKSAKMVPLRWTKWPSELKIEKTFKRHLLFGQWANFKIISPECSLEDPLPVLLKWFCSTRAKNKKYKSWTTSTPRPIGRFQKDFTEMFLGWPSTKLPLWIHSAEQNGHQN